MPIRPDLLLLLLCAGSSGACARPSADTASPPAADDMRLVPGATFIAGTSAESLEAEARNVGLRSPGPLLPEVPAHEVTLQAFYMDTHTVTNANFADFVSANPRWAKDALAREAHNGRYLEHWPDGRPPAGLANHPVVFINWPAAAAYCAWRGKRLPTEYEFEWAAQDGAGGRYPWGDAPPDDSLVSWGGDGIDQTVAAGSYAPNARGLYDMAGNAWQFTADPWLGSWAETLADPAAVAAARDDPSIRRAVRAGSWGASAANLRVRYRDSHRPFDAREMVGFRCARDAGGL